MVQSSPQTASTRKPDLDSGEHIEAFVRRFYEQLLEDDWLAPVFLDVAAIDLDEHLPRIAAYWKKMLLGEPGYDRHMMVHHRNIHAQQSITPEHGRRWLAYFEATLDAYYAGPGAEKARNLAHTIMQNMMVQFAGMPGGYQRPGAGGNNKDES
jgi:hemoglobin